VSFGDCKGCHGEQLDGHANGPSTGAPNLRAVQGWTAQQFITTLRTGVDPSGHALHPPMPWKQVGRMDDQELTAVYQYLRSLPPVAAR
jgi:mono/diheme cytochrome c family protein